MRMPYGHGEGARRRLHGPREAPKIPSYSNVSQSNLPKVPVPLAGSCQVFQNAPLASSVASSVLIRRELL